MRLIDADMLIGYVEQNTDISQFMITYIRGLIREQPTIDAEPVRHGKWAVTPLYTKCSECGESFMLIPQNYCPNCGARMDEE